MGDALDVMLNVMVCVARTVAVCEKSPLRASVTVGVSVTESVCRRGTESDGADGDIETVAVRIDFVASAEKLNVSVALDTALAP